MFSQFNQGRSQMGQAPRPPFLLYSRAVFPFLLLIGLLHLSLSMDPFHSIPSIFYIFFILYFLHSIVSSCPLYFRPTLCNERSRKHCDQQDANSPASQSMFLQFRTDWGCHAPNTPIHLRFGCHTPPLSRFQIPLATCLELNDKFFK